jgi:hypothetical protein
MRPLQKVERLAVQQSRRGDHGTVKRFADSCYVGRTTEAGFWCKGSKKCFGMIANPGNPVAVLQRKAQHPAREAGCTVNPRLKVQLVRKTGPLTVV